MDIEAIKTSLARLRERRALIPSMRDYKPQKSKAKTTKAEPTVELNIDALAGRLSKLFSSSVEVEGEEKGGEV